jgi:hypothetical protein
MEVSDQLHFLATVNREKTTINIEQEAGWVPEKV